MNSAETLAKLVTIEKLLIVLCSHPKFRDHLSDVEAEIHQEYGADLNRMFPSDPGYEERNAIVTNFRDAKRSIETKIEFMGTANE